jgi:hypothetical protein
VPTAMTYNSLRADMVAYLERGSSVDTTVYDQLPKLINSAERRISREAKVLGFKVPIVGTLQAGVAVVPKPDRWRGTASMNFGTGVGNETRKPILPRSYEYCRNYWPTDSETGVPRFYADYDYSNWLIAPTPDADYPFEVQIYQLGALLDDTQQTNWLTVYAPDVLLYAALLEATPFLKNDERIPVWQGLYDRSLAALNAEDQMRVADQSTVRSET